MNITRKGALALAGIGTIAAITSTAEQAEAAETWSLAATTEVTDDVAEAIEEAWDRVEEVVCGWDADTWTVDVSDLDIPTANVSDLVSGFRFAKPHMPYVNLTNLPSTADGDYVGCLRASVPCGVDAAKGAAERIETAISDYVGCVFSSMSATEKVIALHDRLASTVAYDKYASSSTKTPDTPYTAYGALVRRRAVCAGYAAAMQCLCERVGIPCYQVWTSAHAWDVVRLGGVWYHLDVTSDSGSFSSAGMGYVHHTLLLLSQADMQSAGSSHDYSGYTVKCHLSNVPYTEASSSKALFLRSRSTAEAAWHGGTWHYVDSSTTALRSHVLGSSTYSTLKDNGTVRWYVSGSSGTYYSGSQSAAQLVGSKLYYTLPSKLMCYDMAKGTSSVAATVSSSHKIYGLRAEGTADVDGATVMWRLYNPHDGQHLFTSSTTEVDKCQTAGWHYEGVAWLVPATGDKVWRLYNPNNGDHHYTTGWSEVEKCVAVGWTYEGVAFRSADPDDAATIPVYRLYNPYASVGYHHYTTGESEREKCVAAGWVDEGIGWYVLDAGAPTLACEITEPTHLSLVMRDSKSDDVDYLVRVTV